MPSFRRVALACALFTLCGFAHAGGASTLDVLSLTDSPDPLATGQTSTVSAEVRYFAVGHDVGTPLISIDHLVRVNTKVVNPAGTTIRTLASEFSAERPAGQLPGLRTKSVSMLWDGKDAEGATVPADTYTYKVQAQRLIRFTFSICGQIRIEEVIIHQSSTKQGTITVSGVQDETPPLIADFAPAQGTWATQARPSLSASFSDDSSGVDPGSVEVLLDGLPVTVAASADGFTFTPSVDLAQGNHAVSISVTDLAGNTANAVWTFSVDTLPPSIGDLQPAPGVFLNNPRPAVSAAFSDGASGIGVDAATVVVSLDGLDVTAQALVTPEGITYQPTTDLAEGAHQIVIQVSDLLGQSAQGSSSFTLDASPPVISGLSPAHDSWQNALRPAVSAAFSDGMGVGVDLLSVAITLDGVDVTGSAQVDAAGFVFTPDADLAQGPHSLTVSVADALGNTATASATFKVDSVPPVIADLVPTADGAIREALPTLSGSFTETGSGVDTATFELSVDDALTAATAEATGFSYTLAEALGEGLHTARAVVRDLAGNQTTAEWSFTVDTVQPSIVDLVVSPAGITNNPQPLFSASFSDTGSDAGVDPSRVRILLDGVDVSDQGVITALGFTFTPGTALAEGPHVLGVRIEDTAGNAVEATAVVDVDVTAPVLSGVANLVLEAVVPEGSDAFFNAIAAQDTRSGVQTLEFDPPSGSVFPLGITAVTATATDVAGNVSTSVFNVEVVDTTPPTIKVMPPVQIVATGAEGSLVAYDPAIAADAASTPTVQYSHLSGSLFPVGQTTVTVTATDAAGLQAATSFVVTVQSAVRIEVSPPEATIPRNGAQQFTAVVYDEFDQPLVPQPTIIWSVDGGTGTISETGLYRTDQAPADAVGARAGGIGGGDDEGVGTFTVQAQAVDLFASSLITVQPSIFTVEFVRPTLPANFQSPANIELLVEVFSDPSPVVLVEFIVFNSIDGTVQKIGEGVQAPYGVSWPKVLPGRYGIQARALNEEGAIQMAFLDVDVYYNIEEIGLPGESSSEAWGLNMHRHSVGVSKIGGQNRAFLWDAEQSPPWTDLGIGEARAISDSGLVVGQSLFEGESTELHAALWDADGRMDLQALIGTSRTGLAYSINALSKTVGVQNYSLTPGEILPVGAMLWQNSGSQTLWQGYPVPEARGINDLGQVVGWKEVDRRPQAVLWEKSKLTYLTTGEGNGRERGAYAINNVGVVVGECDGFAALWRKATSTQWTKINLQGDLVLEDGEFRHYGGVGTGGRAYAINGCNEIVGYVDDANRADESRQRWAALWTENGGARELNELIPAESGWNLIEARGINANGDIVGVGKKDGQTKAFQLSTGLDSEGEGTRDNTPPTIIPPDDIVVMAKDSTGVIVHYPDPSVMDDHVEPSRLLVYTDPPSGSKIPVGENIVQISVVDECGNLALTTFKIHVVYVEYENLDGGKRPFASPTTLSSLQEDAAVDRLPRHAYRLKIHDSSSEDRKTIQITIADEPATQLTMEKSGIVWTSQSYLVFVPDPLGDEGPAFESPRALLLAGKDVKVHPYSKAKLQVEANLGNRLHKQPLLFFEPLEDFSSKYVAQLEVSSDNNFFSIAMRTGYGGPIVAVPATENFSVDVAWRVVSGPATLRTIFDTTNTCLSSNSLEFNPASLDRVLVQAELKAFTIDNERILVSDQNYSFPEIQRAPGTPSSMTLVLSRDFVSEEGHSISATVEVRDASGRFVEDGTSIDAQVSGHARLATSEHQTLNGTATIAIFPQTAPFSNTGAFALEVSAGAGNLRARAEGGVDPTRPPAGPVGWPPGTIPHRTKPPKPPKPSEFDQVLTTIENPTGNAWADLFVAFLPGVDVPQDLAAVIGDIIKFATGSSEFSALFTAIDAFALATDLIPGADQTADVALKPVKKTAVRVAQAGSSTPLMKKFEDDFKGIIANVDLTSADARKAATQNILAKYEDWKSFGKVLQDNADFAAIYGAKHGTGDAAKHIMDVAAVEASLRLFKGLDDDAAKALGSKLLKTANDVNVESLAKLVRVLGHANNLKSVAALQRLPVARQEALLAGYARLVDGFVHADATDVLNGKGAVSEASIKKLFGDEFSDLLSLPGTSGKLAFPSLKHEEVLEIFSKMPPGVGVREGDKVVNSTGEFFEAFAKDIGRDNLNTLQPQSWNGRVAEAIGVVYRKDAYDLDTLRISTEKFKKRSHVGKLEPVELDSLARTKAPNSRVELGEVKGRSHYQSGVNSTEAGREIDEVIEKRTALVMENRSAFTIDGRRPTLQYTIVLDEDAVVDAQVLEKLEVLKRGSVNWEFDFDFSVIKPSAILDP